MGGHSLRQSDLTLKLAVAGLRAIGPPLLLLRLLLAVCADPNHSVGRGHLHVVLRVDIEQRCPHDKRVAIVKLFYPEPLLLVIIEFEEMPPPLRPGEGRPFDDMTRDM